MAVRVNLEIASRAAALMVARAFDDRIKAAGDALKAAEVAAVRAAFAKITDKDTGRTWLEIYDATPADWLVLTSAAICDPRGRFHRTAQMPLPAMFRSIEKERVQVSERVFDAIAKLHDATRELLAARATAQHKAEATLRAFSSIEAARKGWPEAASFLPVDVAPKAGLPVDLSKLNAELRLPPEEPRATDATEAA